MIKLIFSYISMILSHDRSECLQFTTSCLALHFEQKIDSLIRKMLQYILDI